jgi:hypothetical protein
MFVLFHLKYQNLFTTHFNGVFVFLIRNYVKAILIEKTGLY